MLRRSYLDVLDLSLQATGLPAATGASSATSLAAHLRCRGADVEEFLDPPAAARAAGAAPISAMRCALRINCRNTPRVAGFAVAGGVPPGLPARAPAGRRPRARDAAGTAMAASSSRCSAPSSPSCGTTALTAEVAVLSPLGNEDCAAARLTEQPWRDRLTPLVSEPGEEGEEEEEGDWLAACIPSDLDAVDLRSGKIKYPRSTASRGSRRRP